jgi:hypothetical protein
MITSAPMSINCTSADPEVSGDQLILIFKFSDILGHVIFVNFP